MIKFKSYYYFFLLLNLISLVEYALQMTLVYEIKGITKTHLLKNEKGNTKEYLIQTEGVYKILIKK